MPRRSKNIRRPVLRKEVVFGCVHGSTKLRSLVLRRFAKKWECFDPADTIRRITVETGSTVEDVWGVLCAAYPGLVAGDHRAIEGHSRRAALAARRAQRDQQLRERLATWPTSAWAEIFIERPAWEAELSQEQAARWQAWLEEVKRRRLWETQSNVLEISKAT